MLADDAARIGLALAAARGNAEVIGNLLEGIRTQFHRLADFVFSDSIAVADVHMSITFRVKTHPAKVTDPPAFNLVSPLRQSNKAWCGCPVERVNVIGVVVDNVLSFGKREVKMVIPLHAGQCRMQACVHPGQVKPVYFARLVAGISLAHAKGNA